MGLKTLQHLLVQIQAELDSELSRHYLVILSGNIIQAWLHVRPLQDADKAMSTRLFEMFLCGVTHVGGARVFWSQL